MKGIIGSFVSLVVLSFALSHPTHGQTPTTKTHCDVTGDTADCTSTDNSGEIAAQAEKDRQGYELGKSTGNAMGGLVGLAIRKHAIQKQYKAYCNQHPGETWAWHDAKGNVTDQGTCPGTLSRQQVINLLNKNFVSQNVAGYAEVSGDTLTLHSERATEMRFHMLLNGQMLSLFHKINVKTFLYTNDKDQKYVYDVVTDHVVPTSSQALATAAPFSPPPTRANEVQPSSEAMPATPPPSVSAVVHAVPPEAALPAKPCANVLLDKSGREVCLDQR